MIASIISLDRKAIQSIKMHDAYKLHKLVYSLFPGTERHFLYYDQGGDVWYRRILLLSRQQPSVPDIGKIESKIIPNSFLEYNRYAFQVLLNPVRQQAGDRRKVPVITKDVLYDWFLDRQETWGFVSNSETLEIFNMGVQIIQKADTVITLNMAEFRGVLEVTNRDLFKYSFTNGIGRAKAFGFGLLQIKPLRN